MKKKLTIMLSSYACGPNVGSEPGVGWAWVKNLSPHYNVIVLTSIKYKTEIENSDLFKKAKFYFVNTNKIIEFVFPRLSRWKYYIWQYYAYNKAKDISNEINVDVIHHVTFIQYFTPAFGFFLDVPFVFGPIGGGEVIAKTFYSELGLSTLAKELSRRIFIAFSKYLINTSHKKKLYYIFANSSTRNILKNKNSFKNKLCLLPAIYIDENELNNLSFDHRIKALDSNSNKKLKLILPVRLLDWKGIIFGLNSINEAIKNGAKIELQIIGDGPLRKKTMRFIKKHKLEHQVLLFNKIDRNELLHMYKDVDALFYPAFRDSGAMVIAEAYLSNKPVITLDIDSQYYLKKEFSYKAIVSSSYEATVQNMAECLNNAYTEKESLSKKGIDGRKDLINKLSWSTKIYEISKIYNVLTKENNV